MNITNMLLAVSVMDSIPLDLSLSPCSVNNVVVPILSINKTNIAVRYRLSAP